MKLSTLTEISSASDMIDTFGGYNHNIKIADGEFYDMQNMSSSNYPAISPRERRGRCLTVQDFDTTASVSRPDLYYVSFDDAVFLSRINFVPGTYQFVYEASGWTSDSQPIKIDTFGIGCYTIPTGEAPAVGTVITVTAVVKEFVSSEAYKSLTAKDSLCYIYGNELYINGKKVDGLYIEDEHPKLVSMGAYLIVMPGGIYINTKDFSDCGKIDAEYKSESTVTYSMCMMDGTSYGEPTISDDAPAKPKNGDIWIDTSSTPHVLRQYTSYTDKWVQVATTYIKIACTGIGASFEQYDGVKISGIDTSITQLAELEGKSSAIWEVHHDEDNPENDYIVVIGILDKVTTQTKQLKIERKMPKLDFVIESNNRLWGCRYGQQNGSRTIVNEIYASKLGDFKNWNCFMGISTDSYVANCGTDGEWTGAASYLGYPIFFKENFMHKVYGNYPANYQVQTTECRGVQKGCGGSLAIVNETLLYKSRNGICAYDGSLPREISASLGDIHYTGVDENMNISNGLFNGASAGAHLNKYYISMKSEIDSQWYLFVYDTSLGLWHKEDKLRAHDFCSVGGELYAIDYSDDTKIISLLGSGVKDQSPVSWMVESGILGSSSPYKKYISKLNIRISLDVGTRVNFYIQYDSCGEWKHVSTVNGTGVRSFTVPIRPKRCDHFRIRIQGIGDAKILSISKTIESGSDR